jgi:hypothetical protein
MAKKRQLLGIELRFRPYPAAQTWKQTLNALLAWEPQLRPTFVDKLSDPNAEEPEPWSEALADDLAHRCATEAFTSWLLFREDDEEIRLAVSRREVEVQFSLVAPRPAKDPVQYLFELLKGLSTGARPALGMLFDAESDDAEVIMQGLRGLRTVPPLLYVDLQASNYIGGVARLRNAPCETLDAPGGGVLLVIRRSLWRQPSPEEQARIEAVAKYLGISDANPLVLSRL